MLSRVAPRRGQRQVGSLAMTLHRQAGQKLCRLVPQTIRGLRTLRARHGTETAPVLIRSCPRRIPKLRPEAKLRNNLENLETHTFQVWAWDELANAPPWLSETATVGKLITTPAWQWSDLEVRPLPWLPGEFGAFHLISERHMPCASSHGSAGLASLWISLGPSVMPCNELLRVYEIYIYIYRERERERGREKETERAYGL